MPAQRPRPQARTYAGGCAPKGGIDLWLSFSLSCPYVPARSWRPHAGSYQPPRHARTAPSFSLISLGRPSIPRGPALAPSVSPRTSAGCLRARTHTCTPAHLPRRNVVVPAVPIVRRLRIGGGREQPRPLHDRSPRSSTGRRRGRVGTHAAHPHLVTVEHERRSRWMCLLPQCRWMCLASADGTVNRVTPRNDGLHLPGF
jgi:hypothetical protein